MAETSNGIHLMERPLLSARDKVMRIATQADETRTNKGNLWDTHFYKVVLAGNVEVIKQVVTHLESIGAMQTLDWLFQRNTFVHTKKDQSFKRVRIIRVIMYFLIATVSILLTPVFYGLHYLIGTTLNRKRKRFSKTIELPLACAAFSKKPEMIAFFLSQGVDVDHIDSNHNNVFHYVSDLSAMAPEAAIQIFHKLINAISDLDHVKKLVKHDRNSSGLTAVEYAAKFGSPSLLSQILKQPGIMHQTVLSAKADQVVFCDAARIQDAKTRVEVLDVSRYEAGAMTDQSTILNILSDRDIASMSKPDMRIFKHSEFIGTWLMYKCQQMLSWVVFLNIGHVLITCLMLYILAISFIGRNGVQFRQWRRNEDIQVQLAELEAWSNNSSSIFKHDSFHDMVSQKRLLLQQQWWESMWKEDSSKVQLVLETISQDRDKQLHYRVGEKKTFRNFTDTDMDMMYEQALQMHEFESDISKISLIRLYPEILSQFGKELYLKPELFETFENVFSSKEVPLLYENFTINFNGTTLVPSLAVTLGNVTSLLCVPLPMTSVEQYVDVPPVSSPVSFGDLQELDPAIDSCYYQLFINVAVKTKPCKTNGPEELKKKLYSFHDLYHGDTMHTITLFVVSAMYLYITIDALERCVFLTVPVSYQSRVVDMIYTALVQKAPGSYVHKQLNILSGIVLIYQFHLHEYVHSQTNQRKTTENYYKVEGDVTMLFIVVIMLRFIVHIHALRLVPSVGNFVITMFMMGTNLLHFSTVFSIVLIIFSLLFWVLIDDPDCPLERLYGFQTIAGSTFSTFKLTFGHGDMEQFFRGAPVQFSYVLYMIIVVLLLLNLIIAIMSSTATDIMAEPWRTVLWKIEWLDEATSVEFSLSIFTLVLRKLGIWKYQYSSHRKAGYIVRRTPNGRYRVYIECFYCAGLEA